MNHSNRAKRRLTLREIREIHLRAALIPAKRAGMSKDEVYRLVIEAGRCVDPAMDIQERIPAILGDVFGGGEIHGFDEYYNAYVKQQIAKARAAPIEAGVAERETQSA